MNRSLKRKILAVAVAMILPVTMLFSGCGQDSGADYNPLEGVSTITFTDDCGREVEIPEVITKAAPSGSVAQMVLMTIAPETLVGLSASPSTDQLDYFPEYTWELPTFGQFYGSKANLNMEALIAAQPQVIIDIGDKKRTHKEDMNKIQRQTGIPTIFIETTLDKMPGAYRTLGKLFGKEEVGEELASYIEDTVSYATEQAASINDADKKTVYYGTGASGLDCNANGSIQADVIDIIGAKNAVVGTDVSDKGGGTLVNMEQLYNFDPDVIVVTLDGIYDIIDAGDKSWAELSAVKNGTYYEIPGIPYCWLSGPPSVNRILGIWWLGNLVYPDQYDYDMVAKAQEYYKLFFDYDLSEDEAKAMLANSSLK
ncbi:MAG: ABC transporter substrate-binding protein [Firmicutes bacterium]|nr:ABC transporter substrate-binding protein [Bacillota bacterium]